LLYLPVGHGFFFTSLDNNKIANNLLGRPSFVPLGKLVICEDVQTSSPVVKWQFQVLPN